MITLFINISRTFTRTERLVLYGAFLIIFVAGGMLGVLIFRSATVETPAPSPLYMEGVLGQPTVINPVIAGTNDADRDLIKLLFSDVISLAENYKASDDFRTWDIILKDNLRWSDGKLLTADDILFTLDALQNSESRSPLSLNWQGVVANRISEREIEFTLRIPYVFFLDNLKELLIIPKHIWGAIPITNFHLSQFNLEPVGNGPYQYSSFEKRSDGFITAYNLTANPYFAGNKPFLEKFTVAFYQNPSDLIDAYNSKDIDGFGGISPKNVENIKLSNTILEKTIPRYYALFLNKNIPGLNDPNVIAALNLAINKPEIIERIFLGKALSINEPLLPFIAGYDKNSDPNFEFSPDKSLELLEKSGWKINNSGIREKKIGKQTASLEFSLVIPQIPSLIDTANLVRDYWTAIGVKTNLIILNPADIANEIIKTRNYQMILFGNILKNNPDLFSFWHSSERFYPGLNLSLYENKKVDTLLESVRKETDAEKRNKDLSQIQQLISEDQPAIFLYSPKYLYVAPAHFGGFDEPTISTPADRFQNVSQWYLKTTRVFQ